ncbi:MAG TPA: rRNA adenine dimethyltransferase family protein, partial [Chloroflexota bacterium]|nr:rRNA adenine dimethyltransferase family protein [Chloroflexota bacterium]
MPQRLGQHFLRDGGVLNAITKALRLESRDRVLEIGPGHGVLTRELARQAGTVFAIELDGSLVERLRETFGTAKNVTIIHADALETDPCTLWDERPDGESSLPIGVTGGDNPPYKLAGNIPYYISGALLRRYLGTPCPPSLSVLMVQLEVARRIV